MPNVFVGHPFAGRFPVQRFRRIFRDLPFNVTWGDTGVETRDLLHVIKTRILKADYSIFDLTNWNPNVALELGLSEGLRRRQKEYYILLNTRRSQEVPSDIRGIERLQYQSYDFKPKVGLGDQLVTRLLVKEYWVKKIWKSIPDAGKGLAKRILALHILGRMRSGKPITRDDVRALAKGTGLRQSDLREVLGALTRRRFLKRSRSKRELAYVLRQGLFRNVDGAPG